MTTITDGREMVWGIFNADGYECEDFLGVFGSEERAEQVRTEIEGLIRRFYAEEMESEWHGSVTVRSLTLGSYDIPADAQHILKRESK